jgi:16S rRNA (guanine(966)-N(2))-methyltransferase RsmD
VRIVAGTARGKKLAAPKGRDVRPTSDRVREALFSSIGERVRDASVLDLFAGSGALGLEALSRGARRATFVERSRRTMAVVRRNARDLGFVDRARFIEGSALYSLKQLEKEGARFHIVFLDPPYKGTLLGDALLALGKSGILVEGGLVVAEHPAEVPVLVGEEFHILSKKRYGGTVLSFVQRPIP